MSAYLFDDDQISHVSAAKNAGNYRCKEHSLVLTLVVKDVRHITEVFAFKFKIVSRV